jgi:O-acetyl-ADP-ribose deacetylase (regulator of RNase III)
MGAGLALEFKKRYPDNYSVYKEVCKKPGLKMGGLVCWPIKTDENTRIIINLPTKKHWKDKSKLQDIDISLFALKEFVITRDIPSIAIPALGCGLGGLAWKDVKSLIIKHLSDVEAEIIILEP